MDTFTLKQIGASTAPYAISPIPGPKVKDNKPLLTKIFGIIAVPDLGILTTSLGGGVDAPIVWRSWGLLGGNKAYGPNFQFHEYMKAQNHLTAIMTHFALIIGGILLAIPFMRTIARKLVYQPGDGPTKEQSRNDRVEYRGIGKPDVELENSPRAYCKAAYEGSLYECKFTFSVEGYRRDLVANGVCLVSATSLAQAAMSILKDDHELSSGIYTPACLGQKFIDRLGDAGFKFEKYFLQNEN